MTTESNPVSMVRIKLFARVKIWYNMRWDVAGLWMRSIKGRNYKVSWKQPVGVVDSWVSWLHGRRESRPSDMFRNLRVGVALRQVARFTNEGGGDIRKLCSIRLHSTPPPTWLKNCTRSDFFSTRGIHYYRASDVLEAAMSTKDEKSAKPAAGGGGGGGPLLAPTKGRQKPRVVILGSGWGACRLLKDINTLIYDVVCISPRNHMVFTPLLASTCVGTLEFRSVTEPVRTIQPALSLSPDSFYFPARCTAVDADKHEVGICGDLEA